MKQTTIVYLLLLVLIFAGTENLNSQQNISETNETIFVWGGDINLKFVRYVADLTKKENPKICYLPTASADNADNIKYWGRICNALNLDTIILKVWVSSSEKNQSFEDLLLYSDAIVVGGGNTLNMIGIWKAQGIDTVLQKALKKEIILAGGSAGSICWFQHGISDSRPVNLSLVNGLGFLPCSNCPHYSNEHRKNLYHQMMMDKKISPGYACDERSGILFKNGKAVEFVSQSDKHHSYFVAVDNGIVQSTKMESRILLNKNALLENDFTASSINKTVKELLHSGNKATPINAFIATVKESRLNKAGLGEVEKNAILNISIVELFLYDNKFAGIVNNAYDDYYGLWYFYNSGGTWDSQGEDIGGETIFECEITFREKAKMMIEIAEKNQNKR